MSPTAAALRSAKGSAPSTPRGHSGSGRPGSNRKSLSPRGRSRPEALPGLPGCTSSGDLQLTSPGSAPPPYAGLGRLPRRLTSPPAPRPPGSSPSARRAPAGAALDGAGSRPRGQFGAVGSRREGPAGEGRRRLKKVRAAAQGEAAEGPAERGHGWRDEEAATAAPATHVPRPSSCRHCDCREAPASEPAWTPHVTPSRTLHPGPPRGTPGFVVCGEPPPRGMPGVVVLADYKQDGCLRLGSGA